MRRALLSARAAIAIAALVPLMTGCTAKPSAQASGPAAEDELTLRQIVRDSTRAWMVSGHIPGMAIALVRDGHVAWIEGLGHAKANGDSIDGRTIFEGASLGKPLFAYGVMKLASRGAIDLDAPLGRYLPASIQGVSRDSAVTVARVLSHMSGLDLNAKADGLALAFPPGTKWQYSGVGYVLLQRAVEKVTGEPLDTWMKHEVFDSLGMTHTWYGTKPEAAHDAVVAVGHGRDGAALLPTPWPQANVASSLRTTAEDYAKFMVAALAPAYAAMWKPRLPIDAAHDVSAGLGWEVSDASAPLFFHWGSNPGFKSLAVGVPGKGDAVVILTNADNGLELADVIAPRLLRRDVRALGFELVHPTD